MANPPTTPAHHWATCDWCGPMVVCGHCGNNCCNGGSGDGCPDRCASAYALQKQGPPTGETVRFAATAATDTATPTPTGDPAHA